MDEPHENRDFFADDARRRTRLRRARQASLVARRRSLCRGLGLTKKADRPARRAFVPCGGIARPDARGTDGTSSWR